MTRSLTLVSILAITGSIASFLNARADVPLAAQREAIQKLQFWVGEWKGTGWYAGAGERRESSITETVRLKLGGTAILAEGLGRTKSAEGAENTTHEALGIITFDSAQNRYRFVHFRAGDTMGESELTLIDGGLVWHRKTERGTVRFTAKIDGDTWNEVGEFSADGAAWTKFMEMTLKRQSQTP